MIKILGYKEITTLPEPLQQTAELYEKYSSLNFQIHSVSFHNAVCLGVCSLSFIILHLVNPFVLQ